MAKPGFCDVLKSALTTHHGNEKMTQAKKKDDAYFKAIEYIAGLLIADQPDDATHREADTKLAELARLHGLSYTAVMKDVLGRVKFKLAIVQREAKKLKQ